MLLLVCDADDSSSLPVSPIMLTSPSFARWKQWENEMYNIMGTLRDCRAVKLFYEPLKTAVVGLRAPSSRFFEGSLYKFSKMKSFDS